MANINPKDIENTPKDVFNENFKRQAMNVIGVPKDVLEHIINGNKSIPNKIDVSFIISGEKYTISLTNNESEKRFVAKICKDDNVQQIFQDNFETNVDKNLVCIYIISTREISDGIVEGVIKINKPVLFDGKIL